MNKILFYLTFICITLLGIKPIKTYANTINISPVEEINKYTNTSLASLFLIRYSGSYNLDLLNRKEFALNFSISEPKTTRDLEISYSFEDTSFGSIKNNNGVTFSAPEKIFPGDHSIIITPNKIGSSALIITLTDALTGDSQTRVIKTISRQTNFFLKGQDIVYLKLGDNFTDEGFTAIDAIAGDVTDQVIIDDSALDTNTPGEYIITYELNVNGSKLFLNRVINVSNIDAPIEDLDFGGDYFTYTVSGGYNYIDFPFDVYPINASGEGITVSVANSLDGLLQNINISVDPFNSNITRRTGQLSFEVFDSGEFEFIITTPSGLIKKILIYVDVIPLINSIVLSTPISQIKIGEILEYSLSVNPIEAESSVFYTISEEGIISFNSFSKKITGLKPGKTIITAHSGSGVSDSFEIEVLNQQSPDAVTSITLSPITVNLKTKRSTTLSTTISPNTALDKNVTWKSNNINIARVDDTGKITGVSAGTATITATSVSHPNIKGTTTVNVTLLEPTSVNVTPSSGTLNIGEFLLLTGEVIPRDTGFNSLRYSSSNTSIATVNGAGRVDALAAGTATITVASAYKPSVNTKVQITVINPNVKPTSVKIAPVSSADRLIPYGGSLQLNASVFPDNATNKKIVWRSRDEKTATVSANGLITPVRQSEVGIIAFSEEDNTIRDEIKVRVYAFPSVLDNTDGDFYSKPNETITINVTGQSQFGFGGKVIVETSVNRFASVKDTKTFNYTGGQAISGSFTYKLPANGFSTFRARIVPNGTQHNDNAQVKITGGSKTHTKNLSSTGKTAFP